MQKNILAIDLGKGSIGFAISRSGRFATPLPERRFAAGHYEEALSAVAAVLAKESVERFVIGWPLYPSGDACAMTPIVSDFIALLRERFPTIPVDRQDERNTTSEASDAMHANGISAKKQKKRIDSGAAAIILERYLRALGQF